MNTDVADNSNVPIPHVIESQSAGPLGQELTIPQVHNTDALVKASQMRGALEEANTEFCKNLVDQLQNGEITVDEFVAQVTGETAQCTIVPKQDDEGKLAEEILPGGFISRPSQDFGILPIALQNGETVELEPSAWQFFSQNTDIGFIMGGFANVPGTNQYVFSQYYENDGVYLISLIPTGLESDFKDVNIKLTGDQIAVVTGTEGDSIMAIPVITTNLDGSIKGYELMTLSVVTPGNREELSAFDGDPFNFDFIGLFTDDLGLFGSVGDLDTTFGGGRNSIYPLALKAGSLLSITYKPIAEEDTKTETIRMDISNNGLRGWELATTPEN